MRSVFNIDLLSTECRDSFHCQVAESTAFLTLLYAPVVFMTMVIALCSDCAYDIVLLSYRKNRMTQSPMFNHAMDSFQHAIEHVMDATPRSRKFSILHFDQAVELLVKERLVRSGKSIYRSDGKTLTFHEAFAGALRVTNIPEHPRLEELHDLRNVIQHKGVVPDEITTTFYADSAYRFMKRFLCDELDVVLSDFLSIPQIAVFEAPEPKSLPRKVADALVESESDKDTTARVLTVYTALELAAEHITGASSTNQTKISVKGTFRNAAEAFGIEQKRFNKEWKYIDILRGQIMHSAHVPSEREVEGYQNVAKKVLSLVGFSLPEELKSQIAKSKRL